MSDPLLPTDCRFRDLWMNQKPKQTAHSYHFQTWICCHVVGGSFPSLLMPSPPCIKVAIPFDLQNFRMAFSLSSPSWAASLAEVSRAAAKAPESCHSSSPASTGRGCLKGIAGHGMIQQPQPEVMCIGAAHVTGNPSNRLSCLGSFFGGPNVYRVCIVIVFFNRFYSHL